MNVESARLAKKAADVVTASSGILSLCTQLFMFFIKLQRVVLHNITKSWCLLSAL